jgi:hypothetical protein
MPVNSAQVSSYEAVINTVRTWPARIRFDLVQEVLATLTPEENSATSRQQTLSQALGLLHGSGVPPTDAEVRAMLDERLG